jgi:hypothetical protein
MPRDTPATVTAELHPVLGLISESEWNELGRWIESIPPAPTEWLEGDEEPLDSAPVKPALRARRK